MPEQRAPIILITGASGLLGKALVAEAQKKNARILAHYFLHPGQNHEKLTWIYGDFSNPEGIKKFVTTLGRDLPDCWYLINNYGPMTYRDTDELEGSDFLADMTGNLVVAAEVTFFLLRHAALRSVVNIGYTDAGKVRGFRKILPYALAKNALLDLTRSLAKTYPSLRCNMVSPVTIKDARHRRKGDCQVHPERIAFRVMQVLFGRRTGCNFPVQF